MRMRHQDTLRAMALGLVMVEHFGGRPLNQLIPIGAGSVGVGCFFTLSGFLITGILLESFDARPHAKIGAWLDFYARRLLRLMPAYYAVILALVVVRKASPKSLKRAADAEPPTLTTRLIELARERPIVAGAGAIAAALVIARNPAVLTTIISAAFASRAASQAAPPKKR